MLPTLDHQGTYVSFWRTGQSPSGKTIIWKVGNDVLLGQIKWFAAWRRYCFYPEPETVFEQICLREIAEFIEARTKEHRA